MLARSMFHMSWVPAFFALALSVATFSSSVAARPQDGRLTLKTRKAVVFKDGHALMIKQARGIADDEGHVYTLDVPDTAVLGSIWASAPDNKVLAMRAEYTDDWKRLDQPKTASQTTLSNLLSNLQGKAVTITTAEDGEVTGKIMAVTSIEGARYVLLHAPTVNQSQDAYDPSAVPLTKIVGVRPEEDAEANPGVDPPFVRAKRLSFDLGESSAGKPVELTLMYFTPGIRWIPTYRLSGDLEDKAAMALQAEILNQHEDLNDITLDLVVGVPHFRFGTVISPLSLESTLRNTLAQAAPQLMGQMSNAMFTQRSGEFRPRRSHLAPNAPGVIELPAELAESNDQDLYVYTVEDFSLRSGGRATVPLWQAETPIKHLYTLDLKVIRHGRSGSMVQGEAENPKFPVGSPLRLLRTQVWHQLEMFNRGKVPWTTGAAMILRDDLPIGQDLLTYTPPGGASLLPMTVAINIRGSLSEQEIERKPNALRWAGDNYALIRKRGVITIKSFRNAETDLRVTVSVPGKVEKASDDGDILIDDFHRQDWQSSAFWQNNHSDVTWNLVLKSGEEVKLTYEVSFYVR